METVVETKIEGKKKVNICLNGGENQKRDFVALVSKAYNLGQLSTIGVDFIRISVNDKVTINLSESGLRGNESDSAILYKQK